MNGANLDDGPIRIIICDPRRLPRQSLAAWLHAQPSVEVVATVSSLSELSAAGENLSKLNANVLLMTFSGTVTGPEKIENFAEDRHIIESNLPELRFVAIVDSAHSDPGMLQHGFNALVNSATGTAGVLQSLLRGTSEPIVNLTEGTLEDPGPLTARETEVLQLIGHGSTTEEVAAELGISVSTVASHKERIFAKLDANNQAHAVARAIDMGLLKAIDIRGDISRVTIALDGVQSPAEDSSSKGR